MAEEEEILDIEKFKKWKNENKYTFLLILLVALTAVLILLLYN